MADSIKFTGHYIDTTGTWDSTSSKTQAVINTEKLNISDVVNDYATTVSGKALDARVGANIITKDGTTPTVNTVSDLNNFMSGVTFATTSTTNTPATGNFLVIASGDTNSIRQVAFRWKTGEVWVRYKENTNWSNWSMALLCNFALDTNTNTLNITSL